MNNIFLYNGIHSYSYVVSYVRYAYYSAIL